jgi:hypothetical protein
VNLAALEAVVRAVLYEGYILYPYRSSAVKNRHRWMFGTLSPPGSVEASAMRTECLLRADASARIEVQVRFLHPVEVRSHGGNEISREAVEREVKVGELTIATLGERAHEHPFHFQGGTSLEEGGLEVRAASIVGVVRTRAREVGAGAFQITVDVENTTAPDSMGDVSLVSCASTHTLLGLASGEGGELCSLADPPEDLRVQATACRNVGTWPALLARDTVLSSPIILPDYPKIASESAGDLFDATEIDEILTLRILTLTEAEQDEIRRSGGRARALLERTQALGAREVMRLHGALPTRTAPLCPGDRVRLAPRGRADVFDLVLQGRSATVASIEEDFEGQAYVTVTIDDDPGRDLGFAGKPGHRFFFRTEEVELLP